MRQLSAVILGLWYSAMLAASFAQGVRILAGENSDGATEHYVFLGLFWAVGVGLSSYFAGLKSKRYPVLIGILTSALALYSSFC